MFWSIIKKKIKKLPETSLKDQVVQYSKTAKETSVKHFFDFITNMKIVREKMKNLERTNYELGLFHLSQGNLFDAIMRFRIMRKFWPNNADARYYLAYCLAKNARDMDAIRILAETLAIDPNHELALKLKNDLRSGNFRI